MKNIDWLKSILSGILFNFLVWLSFVKEFYFFEVILYMIMALSYIGLCIPSVFKIKRSIASEFIGHISSIIAWYISINNGGSIFSHLLIIWYLIYFIIIIHNNSKETTYYE